MHSPDPILNPGTLNLIKRSTAALEKGVLINIFFLFFTKFINLNSSSSFNEHFSIISYIDLFEFPGIIFLALKAISSLTTWVWCLIMSAPDLIALSAILIASFKFPL